MTEPAAASTPLESLTPEQASAELTALREHVGLYNDTHPEHRPLTQRMNGLTARIRGDAEPPAPARPPAAAAPPASAEDLTARLAAIADPQTATAVATSALPEFTAPKGEELDVDAVVELRTMEMTHDIPVTELTTLANEYTAAWARRGDVSEGRLDQRDTLLLEAWGDDFEVHLAHAEEMAQQLPPRVRQHATQAGMFRDAMIWIKLAALWERTMAPSTTGGQRNG